MAGQSNQNTYASGLLRETLEGAVEGKSLDAEEWAGTVDETRETALLHFSSLYRERGESFADTPLARLLKTNGQTAEVRRATDEGNPGKTQAFVGLHREEREASRALVEVAEQVAREGTIAAINGPPGAGKTATMLDITRIVGALTGCRIVTNASWSAADEIVRTDVEMLEAMAAEEGPSLGVIDEANDAGLTGRGAEASDAETFATRMTKIRKRQEEHGPHAKQGSLLYVSHNWSRMNKPSREMTTLSISKPSPADKGRLVLYESDGDSDSRRQIAEYTGLTDTREDYSEWDAADFRVADESEETGAQEQGPTPEELRRREKIESAVRAYAPWDDDVSRSYAEVGSIVGRSESWVGKVIRAWRDGEHRDIVSAPDDR